MRTRSLVIALLLVAASTAALAQTPTGTLSGRVDDGTGPLPGATVTVASPNLQGSRTATTSVNGDYIFPFLPPGEYHLRFELQGFQTQETTVKISSAQASTVNATLPQAAVAEEVTVVGTYDTISTSTQVAATMTYDLANKLPVTGTLLSYMALAPGVNTTGPGGNYTISGAQSWENLITVNGVSIQDNVRLTPSNLFIEDAVEETTTQSAAVSAEYGRFAGGVVNMLTKSGGNELHGSLRLGLDTGAFDSRGVLRGGKWQERESLRAGAMDDTVNNTWMATMGGYIWKDRLWYFASGRLRRTEGSNQTSITNIPFTQVTDDKRYEAKLTASLTTNHRVVGSYLKNETSQGNNYYTSARIMDLASVYDRETPSDLLAFHYTGVLSDNLFLEAQYSKKAFSFIGSGSRFTDRIYGTLMIDLARGTSPTYRWWSPTFCGVCDTEKRDNEEYILKGSYFLSSGSLGTHDLVAGFDSFNDQRYVNNYQSGSNYRLYHTSTIIRNGVIYPVISTSNTFIRWTPIFSLTNGMSFKTNSAFVNDKWRLNNNFSFNIGLRYDKNDGKDADGKVVAKDGRLSPRLAASWDVRADGDLVVSASYATYVAAIAGGVANTSATGGQPGTIDFLYNGPEINMDPNGTLVDTATAIGQVFNWFDSVGGTDLQHNPYVDAVELPGATTLIKGSLDSTNATEYTVGATKRLGNRGMVRLDYINRTFHDFYVVQTDLTTGTVTTPNGTFDRGYVINDDDILKRTYQGLQLQAAYRPSDWLNLGGNYTLSKAEGNLDGETAVSGPVTSLIRQYPEYVRASWYAPKGYLSIDQRHRARVWAVADVLSGKRNRLSVSVLESYLSGTPYSASGTIDLRGYVTNPGYVTPPTSTTYFFSKRGAYRTDTVTQTDLSLDYAFTVPALGTNLELFVQPRVINVFNQDAVINPNYAVWTSRNSGKGLTKFDPFNTTPQECTAYSADGMRCTGTGNWMKSNTFGQPVTVDDFQPPRTFTISFGVRF